MAKKKTSQDDITKVGIAPLRGLSYSGNTDLDSILDNELAMRASHLDNASAAPYFNNAGVYDQGLNAIAEDNGQTGNIPYGESVYDRNTIWGEAPDIAQYYQDIRADQQPWYSKILNGVGKAGVLAATTALESAGLLYGIGQGIGNAIEAEEGHGGEAFLNGLWDNPITDALNTLSNASEEWMPNYYTRDEQENPMALRNIFSANTLGDKILKNLGFMVGAFYGGIPASAAIGKIGLAATKSARAAAAAERAGMAARVADLTEEAGGDINKLNKLLSAEHLTEAERGKRILDGFDKIRNTAQTTRATTQVIGSLGSAINEGAIEAINNSNDWANMQKQKANDDFQKQLQNIENTYGRNTDYANVLKTKVAEDYQKRLEEIEKGKARMGNADLLLNIPILTASNMFQLGRLYSRGFDSTRRELGTFWNGHKLEGSLEKGTLKPTGTPKKAILSALAKSNSEGLEEYLQRAASDGAGQAVADSIDRFITSGKGEESKNDVDDYIAGFGKAMADNLDDPSAWEEYFIGAVSSIFGMPVFGSQTKNAYIGRNMPVGIAGGLIGNYRDYMAEHGNNEKSHEYQIAKYLNERVKNPKFKALYDNLRKTGDIDKLLNDALSDEDKAKYKELEFEKLFNDINAAASSGHLEEFKQLIGYNDDYSDKELEDIVKETTRTITANEQKKGDEQRKSFLEGWLEKNNPEGSVHSTDEQDTIKDAENELEEVNQRLNDDNYQEKLEGPFINRNGQMNVQEDENGVKGGEMISILNRNKQHLLDTINNVLKIRNDIDIETDGRLNDDQISLLTQMRSKIWNFDQRSAEMAYDLVNTFRDNGVQNTQEGWKEKIDGELKEAEDDFKKVSNELDNAKKYDSDKKNVERLEKKKAEAEKKLNKAKAAARSVDNVIKLLDILNEQKETTGSERRAMRRGYGEGDVEERGVDAVNRFLGINMETSTKDFKIRNVNSDEAQAILANPQNTLTLLHAITSNISGLDNSDKERLVQEVIDLNDLANQKIKYNEKVREFLGDPKKINEAFQQANDKVSQQDKDNKAEELALRIKNADSMTDLDNIMREAAQADREMARQALQKAKQNADDDTKNFIADYEKGTNFIGSFSSQAMNLPDDVKAGVMDTAQSAWEYALANGVDVYDTFAGALNDAANDLEKDGNSVSKTTAKAIKDIMKDLDAAIRSTVTSSKPKKKTVKKGGDEGAADEEDKKGLAGLAALRRKKEGGEEKKKEETPVTPEPETPVVRGYEDIVRDITTAIEDSRNGDDYDVTKIDDLSEKLRKDINVYNNDNDANRGVLINDGVILSILNKLADDEIKDGEDYDIDDSDSTEIGDNGDDSNRAEEMKANLTVTFKSDHPTEFEINKDYRKPYEPTTEQLKAVQKLLKEAKAYQFLDKNYLGYIAQESEDKVPIHFLKSTDTVIDGNGGNEAIVFLAIEWNDRVERAIRKHAFNNSGAANITDEVKPVTVDGKQYQIVGVLSMATTASQEVSKAFEELQSTINGELNPKMDDAKNNGQQFVVSGLTSSIDSIYTGRLDKGDSEEEGNKRTGLYEFMTQGQGDRRASTEWDTGMDFYFGIVINGIFNTDANDDTVAQMESPNEQWMDKNNGAILLFVPRPDGRLYPVRAIRRTVNEWLDNTVDGSHTGRELLQGVMDGSIKNQYLENIVNFMRTLLNEESQWKDRMLAKIKLSKYFIFGKGNSPIGFDSSIVTLRLGEGEHVVEGNNIDEEVMDFFNTLAANNIMFTLPIDEKLRGNEVIKAGVFETRLSGFYNFNSNFTIVPINGKGEPVIIEQKGDNNPPTGAGNLRVTEIEFDLGNGLETYTIEGDGTVKLNGEPVDTNAQNVITLAIEAENGNLPSYISTQLNTRYSKSPEARKYIADNITQFDSVYAFDSDGETWIYDARKGNHNRRLYKISSEQGKKLVSGINKAIIDFTQKNLLAIKALKKKPEGTGGGTNGGEASTGSYYKIDREDSALQRDGKEGSQLIVDKEGKFTPVSTWNNLYPISNLGKFFKVVDENNKPVARQLWSKAVGYEVIHNGQFGNDEGGIRQVKEKGIIRLLGLKKESVPSTPPVLSPMRFVGKSINDLDDHSSNSLIQALVDNKAVSWVKKIFKALQNAEEQGIAIDDDKVANSIHAIKSMSKEEKRKAFDDLLNEIKGCNRRG